MHVKIELKPFKTPNFVIDVEEDGKSYPLSAVEADDLSAMCHVFRESVFKKAGRVDPIAQAGREG